MLRYQFTYCGRYMLACAECWTGGGAADCMGGLPAAANDAAAATAAPLDTTDGGSPLRSDEVEGMIRSG